MRMDSALAEERDQIGPRVRNLMQTILDRYKVGVEVVGIPDHQLPHATALDGLTGLYSPTTPLLVE
jgi:hypothetical protein